MNARTVLQMATWYDDLEFFIQEDAGTGKFGYWISRGPGGQMSLLLTTGIGHGFTKAHAIGEMRGLLEKVIEISALFSEDDGLMTRAIAGRILLDLETNGFALTHKYK